MEYLEISKLTENMNIHLTEGDKSALYKYASKVKEDGVIVDIGTCAGGSAFFMAAASKPSVRVFTIDPTPAPEFEDNRIKVGFEEKIRLLQETSHNAFLDWRIGFIDMLFIDGVHSYGGVKSDFEDFGSLVLPGGTVVFHDVLLYDNTIGLYVNELIDSKKLEVLEQTNDKWINDKIIGMMVGRKT